MNKKAKIDNRYAAILLIEIIFEKGVINKQTYYNVQKANVQKTSPSSPPNLESNNPAQLAI